MNLTIVSHNRGIEESHRQRGKSVKVVGLKRMSKEEIDIEVDEIKIELNHLTTLIHKGIGEELNQGFYVRKRVKWPVREYFAEKLIFRIVDNGKRESICKQNK